MKYSMAISVMMHVVLLMLGMFFLQCNNKQYYGINSTQHTPTFLNSVLVQQPLITTATKSNREEDIKKIEDTQKHHLLPQSEIKKSEDAPKEAVPLVDKLKQKVVEVNENKKQINLVTKQKKSVNKHNLTLKRLLATKALMGEGETQSKLIVLIHHAIEKYKRYPASAFELEREGQVTISLTLFPDGHIEHLQLEQTSGTRELDQAALKAVKRATPFEGINKLLQEPIVFKIKVDFELTENE